MGEYWIAAVGLAVTVAGGVYQISSSNAAIDAANSVKLPKFNPTKEGEADQLVRDTNRNFYLASDLDYETRLPYAAQGRDFMVADSARDITGEPSQQVASALKTSGVNTNVGGTTFEQARNLGAPILSKEQRDRTFFQTLFSKNLERWTSGLSGHDVMGLRELNTNSQFGFDSNIFTANMNRFNAGVAQQGENLAGLVAGIQGAANIGSQIYQNNQLSQYLNSYDNPLSVNYWRNNATNNPAANGYPAPGTPIQPTGVG